ncbi:SDR family oxidoreductase [Nonomuraea lactucae]|uniref:SDR family oxidoreductase n=1 Tax=Nonomuraea lactucae TaxID=2249762 RepID=UPI000DE52349|nr:NAD(P)H-binding protein [Nonomuraea lactucae]
MILVTGGTGNTGREVVDQLLAAGEEVRVLTRDTGRAAVTLPPGVETAAGDLVSGDGLAAALPGVDAVFLFLDATRSPDGSAGPAAETIARHGVRRVVALSSASAGGDPSNIIAAGHLTAEAALARAGLPATVLRPGEFMSNALGWAGAVRAGEPVRVPFLDHPSAPVDPADIAALAVVALTSDEAKDRVLPISGGEYTTPRRRIETLGGILGREIVAEEVPEAEFVAGMSQTMPAFVVEAVLDLQRQERDKGASTADRLWPAVRELTGREPRTFAQWAAAHRAAFG